MKFSYNWLNSFFESDLPEPEKLADKLMMRFFEVEKVEDMGGDTLIDIDILPNRASDCFSHMGVAREIAAIYGLDLIKPEDGINVVSDSIADLVNLNVQNNSTPRYILRGIKDVKVGETPAFIRERLEVCGLQSVNNIVDITNYVMLETGQPLHAFDGHKVGDKIEVRRGRQDEKIKTLDGKEKKLDNSILVITNGKAPLGLAGIKGGEGPEVDRGTSLIYLEAANFDGRLIRKASQKLKLRTDASSRFSHGLDPELAEEASKRAIHLMEKYADGKPLSEVVDFYPESVNPKIINLSVKNTQSLLGVNISSREVKSILSKLDFNIKKGNNDQLEVEIPTRRRDVSIEEDLIEEVGRLYGYENIEPVRPQAEVTTPKTNYSFFWGDRTREVLKGVGFYESYNYTFINQKVKDIFNYDNLIEMKNPVSSEYKYLRPELIPHLLANVRENEKRVKDVKVFEVGKAFPDEERVVIGGIANSLNFRQLKGVVDLLIENFGVDSFSYKNCAPGNWHTGRAAKIIISGEEVGVLGEVSPELLKEERVESKPLAFQVDMDKMIVLAADKKEYKKISKFPTAVKDLSVLVPTEVRYEEVLDVVKGAAGKLLTETDLFDIYKGDGIPENTKNLGLRFFFQAEDKTLSNEEINDLLEKIISSLEAKSGWKVRKK